MRARSREPQRITESGAAHVDSQPAGGLLLLRWAADGRRSQWKAAAAEEVVCATDFLWEEEASPLRMGNLEELEQEGKRLEGERGR